MKQFLHRLFLLLLTLAPVGRVCAEVTTVDSRVLTEEQLDSLRLTDDFVRASIVVAEPAPVLYSVLGHCAIRLQCSTFGLDYCYAYEGEDETEKILKFFAGDLKMGMMPIPTDSFVVMYARAHRGVREYQLNMPAKAKNRLWELCDKRVAEGMYLQYDYFHRGCALMTSKLILQALEGVEDVEFAEWDEKYNRNRKELVMDYSNHVFPWNFFMLVFIIGSESDKECSKLNKLVIPDDMVEVLQKARVMDQSLVERSYTYLAQHYEPQPHGWFTPLVMSIIILLLAILSILTLSTTNKVIRIIGTGIDYTLLGLQTVIGVFMAYLICFSHLPCTEWNWLFVPFNPLPAMLWHWRRYWAMSWSMVLLIWISGMILWPHTIVDTPHVLLTATIIILCIKQWILTNKKI